MTPAVRAFRPADAPAVADLLRAGAPYQVVSAELQKETMSCTALTRRHRRSADHS